MSTSWQEIAISSMTKEIELLEENQRLAVDEDRPMPAATLHAWTTRISELYTAIAEVKRLRK